MRLINARIVQGKTAEAQEALTRAVEEAFSAQITQTIKHGQDKLQEGTFACFIGAKDQIEAGLKIMLRDGSLQDIFLRHHGQMIQSTRFCERRIFRLDNPFLGPETPLDKPEYWFDPWRAAFLDLNRDRLPAGSVTAGAAPRSAQ